MRRQLLVRRRVLSGTGGLGVGGLFLFLASSAGACALADNVKPFGDDGVPAAEGVDEGAKYKGDAGNGNEGKGAPKDLDVTDRGREEAVWLEKGNIKVDKREGAEDVGEPVPCGTGEAGGGDASDKDKLLDGEEGRDAGREVGDGEEADAQGDEAHHDKGGDDEERKLAVVALFANPAGPIVLVKGGGDARVAKVSRVPERGIALLRVALPGRADVDGADVGELAHGAAARVVDAAPARLDKLRVRPVGLVGPDTRSSGAVPALGAGQTGAVGEPLAFCRAGKRGRAVDVKQARVVGHVPVDRRDEHPRVAFRQPRGDGGCDGGVGQGSNPGYNRREGASAVCDRRRGGRRRRGVKEDYLLARFEDEDDFDHRLGKLDPEGPRPAFCPDGTRDNAVDTGLQGTSLGDRIRDDHRDRRRRRGRWGRRRRRRGRRGDLGGRPGVGVRPVVVSGRRGGRKERVGGNIRCQGSIRGNGGTNFTRGRADAGADVSENGLDGTRVWDDAANEDGAGGTLVEDDERAVAVDGHVGNVAKGGREVSKDGGRVSRASNEVGGVDRESTRGRLGKGDRVDLEGFCHVESRVGEVPFDGRDKRINQADGEGWVYFAIFFGYSRRRFVSGRDLTSGGEGERATGASSNDKGVEEAVWVFPGLVDDDDNGAGTKSKDTWAGMSGDDLDCGQAAAKDDDTLLCGFGLVVLVVSSIPRAFVRKGGFALAARKTTNPAKVKVESHKVEVEKGCSGKGARVCVVCHKHKPHGGPSFGVDAKHGVGRG